MGKRKPNGQFEMDDGTYVDSKGYLAICAGPLRGMRVHKLVALAKFGKDAIDPKNHVHHVDGDKANPHPDNLELMRAPIHNSVSARQYHYLKTNVWPKEKAEWEAYFREANGA
jgi:hypothetical protein